MCGIAGIIGTNWERAKLESMISIQHHRGPDASGVYMNPNEQVGLGHNRLSIVDLSAAGNQPMANHDGTVWIVFNGEIYNYLELRSELKDYPYRSRTDTEVILAAYERWGEHCVEHFVGMFAFALWDERNQYLFCARDRLGIKPFHYTRHKNIFLFASEIKALLAAGYPAKPNFAMWATYLAHGVYDHSTETFFTGIRALPPGHILKVQNGEESLHSYWDLPTLAAEPLTLTDEEAGERLLELLKESVRLRLRSDVPLGVNLSGGLDSSSLMVMVDCLLRDRGDVKAFTASFSDPRYDEQDFASQVPCRNVWSRQLQRLDHAKAWDIALEALWHQEAPYGGIATLAYHHLHRLAQDNEVTVLLEGQGVDEMLAGYNYFRPYHYLDLLEQGRWQNLRSELAACEAGGQWELGAMRKLRSGDGLNIYQDGTSHLQAHCVKPEVRKLACSHPHFPQPFSDHLTNALYRDLRYTKLPRVLRMNDRLSMAFSRELREPYLDHRLVEFVFRLPGHQKIRAGQSKFLLRNAMAKRLPDSIRVATKRGVVTPQREWLRTILRPQVDEIIQSRSFAERELFDVKEVQSSYNKFCAGEGENAFFVWQWVNTELWWRMFMDQRVPT
jgi:asparagine synthase (glutamine-hydrolysing)